MEDQQRKLTKAGIISVLLNGNNNNIVNILEIIANSSSTNEPCILMVTPEMYMKVEPKINDLFKNGRVSLVAIDEVRCIYMHEVV